MVKRKFLTSVNNFHTHTWKFGDKRTSINNSHSHPINFRKKLAEKGKTNHTHKLLKHIF